MSRDNIVKLFLVLTLAIVSTLLIRNSVEFHKLKTSNQKQTTDTIWIKRFKPIEPYKIIEIPKHVLMYHTDTIHVKEIIYQQNSIQVTLGNNQVLNYSSQFLAQYPNSGKLVQFLVKNNQLELTQFSNLGQLSTQVYKFRPEFYNYAYANNQLSTQPKGFFQKFGISSEFMYRPVNNLYDLNLGIIHKTSFSIIELGFNLHYYPIWQGNPSIEPYIKLRYQM